MPTLSTGESLRAPLILAPSMLTSVATIVGRTACSMLPPDEDENPGASQPALEPVSYTGKMTIYGHATTVAQIHKTELVVNLLTTIALSLLAILILITSALAMIYAPDSRSGLVLYLAVPGWIIALGIGGFAVFRIRVTKSGLEIAGQTPAPSRPTSQSSGRQPKPRKSPPG